MKAKLFLISIFCFILCGQIHAEDKAKLLSPEVRDVYLSCVQMSRAIGSSNKPMLQEANAKLKKSDTKDFNFLHPIDNDQLSLDGHFVFDEEFVDSLLAGHNVYLFAQRYAQNRAKRGTAATGKVYIKTYAVKASSSVKYSLASKGRQELAVVAEPGGLISLRIYDKTNKKWYNDTVNVKIGDSSRVLVFDLPSDKKCPLVLEVINCSKKDISFVVISN